MQQGAEGRPGRRWIDRGQALGASRGWWDSESASYHHEHDEFLSGDLVWGPEGLAESSARLLGPSAEGLRVLELGCGSAQGTAWLAAEGAHAIGLDLSRGMLALAPHGLRLVEASADSLPFADCAFDAVASAHGSLAFLPDLGAALGEAARVLRPGGRLVFSVTHPIRWCFADDPGEEGLVAMLSYFDRTPYVELDDSGSPTYVEHHRTVGDTVAAIVASGLLVEAMVEPEWPEWNHAEWGAWSPLRGGLIPGTAVWVCRKPAHPPTAWPG